MMAHAALPPHPCARTQPIKAPETQHRKRASAMWLLCRCTCAVRPTPPQKRRKGMARLWSITSSRYFLAFASSMCFNAHAASRVFLKCALRSLPLACNPRMAPCCQRRLQSPPLLGWLMQPLCCRDRRLTLYETVTASGHCRRTLSVRERC